MGGMNLVIHAIVVVTIGLVTSRMLLSYTCYYCCYLLSSGYQLSNCYQLSLVVNFKIKMNCKLAFKCITLLQLKTCFMLKVSPELTPLK